MSNEREIKPPSTFKQTLSGMLRQFDSNMLRMGDEYQNLYTQFLQLYFENIELKREIAQLREGSPTLYKWDMIPEGYNYVACDADKIYCYKIAPTCFGNLCWNIETVWQFGRDVRQLPLTVLNRLPGDPCTTLEKRPGVE